MHIVLHENKQYILRFDPGEEVLGELAKFCASQKISGASFSAIGAAGEATISYYDLDKKVYHDKELKERIEIVSLLGSVAEMDGKIIIHVHGSFSHSDMRMEGGHVKKLVVSATCELALTVYSTPLHRAPDPATGLNLLQ